MPDLSADAAGQWLKHRIPDWPERQGTVVPFADGDPDTSAVLEELGNVLDQSATRNARGVAGILATDPGQQYTRTILAHAGLPRRIRLVEWISSGLPDGMDVLQKIIRPAEGHQDTDDGEAAAITASISELHRQGLLARIFHPNRLDALLAACAVPQEVSS